MMTKQQNRANRRAWHAEQKRREYCSGGSRPEMARSAKRSAAKAARRASKLETLYFEEYDLP